MAGNQTFTLNIKAVANMQDVISNIQQIQNALGKLKMPEGLKTSFSKIFSDLEKETGRYQELLTKGFKTKGDASAFTKSGNNILRLYDELVSKIKSIDDSNLKNMFKDLGTQEIQRLKEELNGLQESLKSKINGKEFASGFKTQLQDIRDQFKETNKDASELAAKLQKSTFNTFTKNLSEGRLDLAANNLKSIREQIDALGDKAPDNLKQWIEDLSNAFQKLKSDSSIQETVNQLEQIKGKLTGAEAQAIQEMINGFRQFQGTVADSNKEVQRLITSEQQAAASTVQFNRELGQVKSRIQYFLGLSNAINLVKRAIRGAVETIKGLDKAMTETAVVTNYTIKDMWDQLPEYTKRANELGVTTKDAYESATLYFQQGLNAEQAAALSTETLKMARIAGLDAAEATDRMTNALRGFNMALDEKSAQRVDDVYSELAAHTASNVDEISTAMTKVASLAHNANMEFETTAAFLAQIIETTRESAETAGTALKTVVARFSEVKKLVDEGTLRGQDEEGQAIDVNKVGAALRTAGIDLNKYFLGEVGLDDIFIELASKWDSLTAVQQRYIATQAAGSRQQSRFIALMQDYARTQELVSMAYDAEGASQKQFEKTQDSLQSKLARLKNAWNEFLMGLANNVVVKGFVDLLTNLLNVVNNLTSAFGEGAGTILKWVAAISAFSGIKALFRGGGFIDKLLMTALSGSGLGRAALKSGLLTGRLFNGGFATTDMLASGMDKEQIAALQKQQGARFGLFGGIGNLGKSIWSGAKNLGTFTTGAGTIMGGGFGQWGVGAKLTGSAGMAAGLTGIATAIVAIGIAIGAAVAAYQLWLNLTPEGKLKKAQKEAEKLKKISEEADKDLKSKEGLQETYQEQTAKVENATTAADRQAAVEERNQAILDAIQKDGTLAQYVVTEKVEDSIVLTIDENALANAINDASKAAQDAAIKLQFGEATVDQRQADVYKEQLKSIWAGVKGMSTRDARDFNYTAEELYNQILNAPNVSNKNLQRAAELYTSYTSAMGSASQKAKIGYGQQLAQLGVSDELANALMPVLGDVFEQTGKQLSSDKIFDILSIGERNLLPLLNAYNGQGDFFENLLNTDVDAITLKDTFGITEDVLNRFAELTGRSAEEIENHIKYQAKLNKEIQQQGKIKAVASLYKAGLTSSELLDEIANKLSLSKNQELANFAEQWSNYSTDFNNILLTKASSAMLGGIWEGSDLQSFIGNIGENPILAFDAIKNAAEDAQSPVHDLAAELKSLIDLGKESAFSKENQVQWFLASSEFDELNDQIEKFIEANGQITSHNVEALAAECKTLNTLLENDVISANALAMAISALQSGNVSLFDLNEQVLTLFENFESVSNIIARAGQFIKDFDAGEDWGDAFDFIDDAVEKMTGFVDNRELGNPQLRNYWKAFFTTDPKDISEWEQGIALIKDLQDMGGGDFWTDVIGFSMDEEGIIADMGLEGFASSEFGSYRDYIKSLAEKNGYTDFADTYYDLMIRNAGNHDYGFIKDVAAVEIQKIVEAYGEGIGEGTPTKADIQAIADAYGLDPQALLDAYTEKFDLEHLDFSKLQDKIRETFTTANDFTDGRASINEMLKSFGIGADGTFSLDTLKLKIKEVVPEVADGSISIEDWFNEQVAANGGTVKLPVEYQVPKKLEDGSWTTETIKTTIEVENLDQYEQAVKTIQEAANQDVLGASIVGALGDANEEAASLVALITDLGSETKLDSVTVEIKTAVDKAGQLNDALSAEINKHVNIIPNQSSVTVGDGGTSVVLHIGVAAKGGIVQSAAAGTIKPGLALTGEEEPEIVWNKEKGYAYLAGANGPEINDLQPGDQVFNGEQTKQILKRSGLKSFAKGTISSYAGTTWAETTDKDKNGGGSSGDKKSSSEWRNELDWLYDLMEDIAEYERQQTLIQDDYDLALKDLAKTGRDLYNLTKDELENLQAQREGQEGAQAKRLQQMLELQSEVNKAGYGKYVQYNQKDRTLEIDWDAIEAIQDKDTYDAVTDYLKRMETVQDQMDDAEQALKEIDKRIQELEERFLQKYLDFQNRVLEAVVKQYQDAIDNLSELNNKLDDTNQSILDSIQKEIDLERQIRDNTDTESNIADMEARLAYLQRDTSGANDKEIRELQKQLDDARESYSDTLIDQAIERLSQNNEEASEQRNKQIELMQAQLDYWQESGGLWDEVNGLIATGFDADGKIILGSELENVLRNAEDYEAMSEAQRENWANELILETNEVGAYIIKLNEGMDLNAERVRALLEEISGKIGGTPEHSIAAKKDSDGGSGGGGSGGGDSGNKDVPKRSEKSRKWSYIDDNTCRLTIYYTDGSQTNQNKQHNRQFNHWEDNDAIDICTQCKHSWRRKNARGGGGSGGAHGGSLTSRAMVRFATGGLNTQTGPAWLDGTPSEPEYVLNARQTTAFLRLAEVLPAAMNGSAPTAANYGGDIYLDLSMHVDEIASDYDVDRIADRVKEIIYDASSYRNVNTLNFIR